MLTLETMKEIQLRPVPQMQKVFGWIVRANYRLPMTRTKLFVEHEENLPTSAAYLAMNHTDRFNYWPLQVYLWRERGEFTATWVKGKYYNHPVSKQFMVSTNQIPAPSRGYLITSDCIQVFGSSPSGDLYRLIRDALDQSWEDEALHKAADEAGFRREIDHLFKTPRDLLGLDYNPWKHGFVERHRELFRQMMDEFIRLNYEAQDLNLRTLVFPEGTRSVTLGEGKPGLAQMALRTQASIVPIGCNGSEKAYPGDSPFSSGGKITYRVGEPLTPKGELKPYQVEEDFRPFTDEAHKFDAQIEGVTDLVMERIAGLLDDYYLEGDSTAVSGANRFA